jgi:hypothetical protein
MPLLKSANLCGKANKAGGLPPDPEDIYEQKMPVRDWFTGT